MCLFFFSLETGLLRISALCQDLSSNLPHYAFPGLTAIKTPSGLNHLILLVHDIWSFLQPLRIPDPISNNVMFRESIYATYMCQDMPLGIRIILSWKHLGFKRYRKKHFWSFPFLLKSKNFQEMNTAGNPFSQGRFMATEKMEIQHRVDLHKENILIGFSHIFTFS